MIGNTHSRLVLLTTLLVAGGLFALAFLVGRSSAPSDVALADPDPAAPPPSVTATITLEEPTSRPTLGPGGVGQENPPGPDVMPDPNATPDITQNWWYIPYINYDARQPIETLTLNGITVGPDVERASTVCDGGARLVALEEVAGSRVGIRLTALPEDGIRKSGEEGNLSANDDHAGICDEEAQFAQMNMSLPVNSSASRVGGSLLIVRWFGEPQERIDLPTYRWSEGTVAGFPAAIGAPILPELGFGDSAVLIFDGSVMTKIQADGIPLEHLLAIAEEIVR